MRLIEPVESVPIARPSLPVNRLPAPKLPVQIIKPVPVDPAPVKTHKPEPVKVFPVSKPKPNPANPGAGNDEMISGLMSRVADKNFLGRPELPVGLRLVEAPTKRPTQNKIARPLPTGSKVSTPAPDAPAIQTMAPVPPDTPTEVLPTAPAPTAAQSAVRNGGVIEPHYRTMTGQGGAVQGGMMDGVDRNLMMILGVGLLMVVMRS